MNKAEQIERAIHCFRVSIDEEVCEECVSYGEMGCDHCQHDCQVLAIEVLQQALEREKNEPLTLEQLKDMVGEPIFVAYGGNMDYDELYEWKLIDAVNEQGIVFTDYTSFDLDDCKYIGFYKYKKERD